MSSQKSRLTYAAALRELQEIVSQLQEEKIGMDDLSDRILRATELLKFCREKLRATESEVKSLLEG